MIEGELNATTFDDYPPGHPAGADEFISGGEVLSGRSIGSGGVLGVHARSTEEPTRPVDAPTAAAVATGPTVLIAVDGESISEHVVRTAHRLFGDDASYLAINVGDGRYTTMSWAYAWPWVEPTDKPPSAWVDDARNGPRDPGTTNASAEAAKVTRDAGLSQATPLGDVGDPSMAIIQAAHDHHADVVVIGADSRGWLSHLIDGFVERDLLREADFAILVVDVETPVARQ